MLDPQTIFFLDIPPPKKDLRANKNQIPPLSFFLFMAILIIPALVKRFNVSSMWDFLFLYFKLCVHKLFAIQPVWFTFLLKFTTVLYNVYCSNIVLNIFQHLSKLEEKKRYLLIICLRDVYFSLHNNSKFKRNISHQSIKSPQVWQDKFY